MTPTFRGVYVDHSELIIGTPQEDELLQWCAKNDINELSLYGASAMCQNKVKSATLQKFIDKCKNVNINVSAIASNMEQVDFLYRRALSFSGITTEYEFWNNGNSYAAFKSLLEHIKWSKWPTNAYFSQFKDAAGIVTDEATIAQRVVSADRVFLVNYIHNSYNLSDTILKKLKTLALAAFKTNKVVDIVILFNANTGSTDPSIYEWLKDHSMAEAFSTFKAQYDAAVISHKSSLNLVGFQVYKYSSLK